ncbi:hypothetical protein KJ059_18660, partial [Myxococcota bacterium]|nr:hypothetical protein [Myxococcota bacterium]
RFGARDYDPRVGRWTSKDRAGVLLVNNLFAYASLDPINRIDATGTLPQDIDDAVNWARANYPPLAKPLSRVADLPASGALGALGIEGAAVGSTIYLDPKYRTKCLSESERNELHNLILHELLHLYVNQQVGTWRYLARNHALTDQPDHNWIYDQAARINNWRLGIGPVGMPKPALGKPPSAQD